LRRKAKRAARPREKTPDEVLQSLPTEQPNAASRGLDEKSALAIARIINREDAKVANVVSRSLPKIAEAIEVVAHALGEGGRLIYVGTGTSGRIAALDAVECAPTFDLDPSRVQFIIAGGNKALTSAVEADEDSRELGRRAMAKKSPTKKDVVVGVAASGRTPFTIAAVAYARSRGAQTIAVVCNRNSALERAAELSIVAEVGPEVIAGSTRMKAGTAQKMILNMLSTGAMARLGYVYGNLMVNLRPKNLKLRERGVAIVESVTGLEDQMARRILESAGRVPVALVMAQAGVSRSEAIRALQRAKGKIRDAVRSTKAE
jgi:N-acetylmuramic acid 6-phosphate etherase